MSSFRDSIRDSNGGAYLLFVASFVFFVGVGGGLSLVMGFQASTIATEVLGILGAAIIWRQIGADAAADWPSFGLKLSPVAVVLVVVTSVIIGFLANTLASLSVELIPALESIAQAYNERISELLLDATGVQRVLGIVGVCVAAPLCEEALFRGTILQEQRKSESVAVAVIANGVMFAAFHVNPVSGVGLAILGMFFAHIAIGSGSLWPSIIAHTAVNVTNAVILPAFFPDSGDLQTAASTAELGILTLCLAAATGLLWWLTVRQIHGAAGD